MSASSTPETSRTNSQGEAAETGKATRLAGKLAALTGAAGAALTGEALAAPITYTPTAGVAAAQNIPGFSFTPPLTVTPGTLRPPASEGVTAWDIDGNGTPDFNLVNTGAFGTPVGLLQPLAPFSLSPNGLLDEPPENAYLRNLADRFVVGPSATSWLAQGQPLTVAGGKGAFTAPNFSLGTVGYFGFRFAFENVLNEYYYGWASLTIDGAGGSVVAGQGFKIGEAFYQTTPNTAIQVGDVPLGGPAPVPELSGEPSGIALLAAGFFGLEALRARRRRPALAC